MQLVLFSCFSLTPVRSYSMSDLPSDQAVSLRYPTSRSVQSEYTGLLFLLLCHSLTPSGLIMQWDIL